MSLANRHNLDSGPFGLCSGYWDKDANIFRKADQTDIAICCMKTCETFVDECKEQCPKAEPKYQHLCYQTCDDIQTSCGDFCDLSSPVWGSDNPILKGSREKGCGDGIYKSLDKECVKNNKNDIINICLNTCIDSDQLDCEKHCNYSYKIISDEDNKKNNSLYESVRKQKGYNMYIIYFFAIIFIIFGIWILVRL
jgi:hypothetical protein